MRKNKGYQLDIYKSWRGKEEKLSRASGVNKTPEQILEEVNAGFDYRVRTCQKEYEKIAKKITLVGEDLRKYCKDYMLWEVKFDTDGNLIPLEEALIMLEKDRQRYLGKCLYSKWIGYQKRIIHKDNQKFVYNNRSGSSGSRNIVRIPSLKRSKATWKRFYELFPYYQENYNKLVKEKRLKLKRVW